MEEALQPPQIGPIGEDASRVVKDRKPIGSEAKSQPQTEAIPPQTTTESKPYDFKANVRGSRSLSNPGEPSDYAARLESLNRRIDERLWNKK